FLLRRNMLIDTPLSTSLTHVYCPEGQIIPKEFSIHKVNPAGPDFGPSRVRIHAKRFLFHRNAISYKIKIPRKLNVFRGKFNAEDGT
ncbi:hypothetical protein, partial [Eubacterium ventriosum]|uniref:hypothetical protein n=1 Tax=Eubacterium ventriosum TaxID=39496 RepID=UPI002E771CF1